MAWIHDLGGVVTPNGDNLEQIPGLVWPGKFARPEQMNPAITTFADELAADPTTRGVLLFGSQARGTARPDSDADLVIVVDRPGFVMGVAERDGQEFELVYVSEATAMAYFSENCDAAADAWASAKILYDPYGSLARVRDHVAAIVARGKPALDASRAHYLRAAAEDRFRAAAGLATDNDAAARMLLFERLLDLVGTFFDVRQIWAHQATPRRNRPPQPRFARLDHSHLLCGRLHDRKGPPGTPRSSARVRPVLVDSQQSAQR